MIFPKELILCKHKNIQAIKAHPHYNGSPNLNGPQCTMQSNLFLLNSVYITVNTWRTPAVYEAYTAESEAMEYQESMLLLCAHNCSVYGIRSVYQLTI